MERQPSAARIFPSRASMQRGLQSWDTRAPYLGSQHT